MEETRQTGTITSFFGVIIMGKTKVFKVSFEVSTQDRDITEADIQGEMERLEWSTMLTIKNVKVEKQP